MRKVVFSLVAASSLLLAHVSTDAKAEVNSRQAKSTISYQSTSNSYSNLTYETVEKVSSGKATAKTGTFKLNYNTNVRTDAGTKNKIIITAKKGSIATATHQKKVGKETWYKVNVSGKSGWVLSTLLTPQTSNSSAKQTTNATTSTTGTFTTKYNSNVRANAGTNNKILTTAKKGTTVKATAQKKVGNVTWYKVTANGKTGWVSGDLLAKTNAKATAAPKKATAKSAAPKESAASGTFTTKYNSNIRSNAGTNNKIVLTAKKGTTVKATAQKKVGNVTWYKVTANGKTGWVSGDLLTKTTAKAAAKKPAVSKTSNSTASSNLVNNALALKGIPYRFGGASLAGFDCSGFVQYAFKQSGKSISRSTLGQYADTSKVSNPQPGDLVFFAGTYRSGISHVGIYIGNNQFVHAAGTSVRVNNVNEAYWKKHFHSYRR